MNLFFSLPLSLPLPPLLPSSATRHTSYYVFRPITSSSIGSFVQHHTTTTFSNIVSVKGNRKTKKRKSEITESWFAKYMLVC